MDKAISPVVEPMIKGLTQVLNPSQTYRLATWLTKLVLVYESLGGDDRIVEQPLYETFWRKQRPFPEDPIQLARFTGTEFRHAYVRCPLTVKNGGDVAGTEGVLITFAIGQLIAQASLPVLGRRGLVMASERAERVTIWPGIPLGTVTWPPLVVVSTTQDFIEFSKPFI
jgi:hypothetical protein